jgi:dephospho-CoA kinase
MTEAMAIAEDVRRPSYVPAEETILLAFGPSVWFIVLRSLGAIAAVAMLAAFAWWAAGELGFVAVRQQIVQAGVGIVVVMLAWNLLVWSCRDYVLTDKRVIRAAGVIRRIVTDAPLRSIQHVTLTKLARERVLGLGTIGFNTAGTAWTEVMWVMIDRPEEVLAVVRKAMEDAGNTRAEGPRRQSREIPVIGVAGGVGSGKSEVARMLGALGAIVIDSDVQARAALDTPAVKEQLVRWWGAGVLRSDGSVDRSAVADIVFRDERERRKLEGLIHPMVRSRRAEVIARAREAGAPMAVIDAPLLFEAGVDAECDAVVFVDVPRDVRLSRVREGRGWDEQELERRERNQMPLEEKRQRSRFVVANTGNREALRADVERLFGKLRGLAERGEEAEGGGGGGFTGGPTVDR